MQVNMDIQKQQLIANILLTKLEAIDPFCILAGGAPRDWYFGREATDLDFYMYIGSMSLSELHRRLYDLGLIDNSQAHSADFIDDDDYIKSDRLKWILTFYYDSQKVQVMVMRKPVIESVLSHFSLSICRIWYKNQTTYFTPEFLKTVEEKTIRQVQEAFGVGYIDKIRAKFPDYGFVGLSQDIEDFEF